MLDELLEQRDDEDDELELLHELPDRRDRPLLEAVPTPSNAAHPRLIPRTSEENTGRRGIPPPPGSSF